MSNIPLNIDWQQILLHFFNFSILVGGLYLLLFKPVKDFMDKRVKHYADMESAAQEREKHTADLEAALKQREAAFDAELEEKRAAAAKEAEAFAQQQRAAAQQQADKLLAAARENAEKDRGRGQPRGRVHRRGRHGEAPGRPDRPRLRQLCKRRRRGGEP